MGETPLIAAAKERHLRLCQALMRAGADALRHDAARKSSADYFPLLLEHVVREKRAATLGRKQVREGGHACQCNLPLEASLLDLSCTVSMS